MSEAKLKRNFEQDLNRVKDALVAASEHYNIWWIYKNEDDRPKYVNVMNRYLGFFRTSISAQFTALLLTLSKALEKGTDSNISLHVLVKSAEKNNLIELSALQEIKNELNSLDGLFEKVRTLRNKHFAHLQNNLNAREVFNRAGISPNDLKKLIDLSIDILKSIYYAYNRGDFVFDYGAKNDTYSLLNDLLKTDKC
jgi:hypothetical protein